MNKYKDASGEIALLTKFIGVLTKVLTPNAFEIIDQNFTSNK